MAEEDNPFLIKKKPANESAEKEPETIQDFSFGISPEEAKKILNMRWSITRLRMRKKKLDPAHHQDHGSFRVDHLGLSS